MPEDMMEDLDKYCLVEENAAVDAEDEETNDKYV
jgi:hypothetical protein